MNKNQTWRRVLSLLCAMVMLVGMMVVGTVVASAAEANVAKVGDTEYATLQAAINAAEAGDTVVLLKDITLGTYAQGNTSAAITINKAITLDGDGHIFTSKAGRAINIDVAGEVEIKNLTIKQYCGRNGNDQKRCINVINQTATVKVTGCTLEMVEHNGGGRWLTSYVAGVQAATGSNHNITIDGCTINTIYGVVVYAAGSEIDVQNSNIGNALYGFWINAECDVDVVNSTITTKEDMGMNNLAVAALIQAGGVDLTADANTTISVPAPKGAVDGYTKGQGYAVYSRVPEEYAAVVDISKATIEKSYAGDPVVYLEQADVQIERADGSVMYYNVNDAVVDLQEGDKITVLDEENVTEEDVNNALEDAGFVLNEDGKIVLAAVAQIGEKTYTSLQAALDAAVNGDTVTLLADANENVTVNKSITLDGANFKYTGTINVTNVTAKFQNINFVNGNIVKNDSAIAGAFITVTNCHFNGAGSEGYGVKVGHAEKVTVSNCTADGVGILYINLTVYEVNVDGVVVKNIAPGGWAMYLVPAAEYNISNVTMTENVYSAIAVRNQSEPRNINLTNCNFANNTIALIIVEDTNYTNCNVNFNLYGTNTLSARYTLYTVTNMTWDHAGNDNATFVLAAGATLTAPADLKVVHNVADSCLYYADGVYSVKAHSYKDTVTPPTAESQGFTTHECENCGHSYVDSYVDAISYVAEVNGVKYSTIKAAIKAAVDGNIVYLIDDVTENVTIEKSITLDGADFKYTGTMTVAAGKNITIKNVNFVNAGILKSAGTATGKYTVTNCTFDGANNTYAYAFSFKGANTVIIENCSVKDYMYSFLYVRSAVNTITVKNVSVEDCPNYAVYFASGVNNASFENLTVKNSNIGFLINNTANRTLTVKNCVMENVTNPIQHNSGTLTITCKLLGENDFGGAAVSNYAKLVLLDTNTTVTAPETANVGVATDLAANYRAVFADGKWSVKEIDFVAEVNGQKFESLQAAIDAAADGDTVIMLKNVEYTLDDVITTSSNLTTIIKVEGKSITLDMDGNKISLVHESTKTRIYSVVYVGKGAGLTVIGNGTIDVLTHETSPKVAYMFLKDGAEGYLNIESGYFHMNNSEDSMLYTNADRVITVKGGTFVLDKAGVRANGFPCIFNAKGNNERKIVVTGGSFNVDVNHQYWCFEVEIDKTLALSEKNGMWTVVPAAAYVGEIEGPYIHNVGYATVEEAGVRAAQLGDGFSTLVVLQDTLKSANLFVGSYINVYFNVYKSSFSSALKYTAYVYDAKGNVVEIPSNLWESHADSPDVYKINFKKLAAKQMADEFTIKIVCKDERVSLQKNIVENFSVKSYVENGWGSFNGNQRKLLSAMLVYGSAAQDAFKHNTADKADDVTVKLDVTSVPEELKVDNSVALRSYYYGASLTLENTIYFNFKFFADSVGDAAYAVIEAGGKAIRVDAEDFTYETKQGGKKVVVVTFDASVANATELAKCTFYAADKTAIVSAQDNILSYCYRAIEGISATPGYNGSLGVDFYTALANYAYAVSKYSK